MAENEPTPERGATMPAWLSPGAREHWPTVAAQLEAAGVLTQMDAAALGVYCETFSRWKAANDKVVELGLLVKSGKAEDSPPMISPYLSIANRAQDQMLKILVEFGMTPSSRTRVAATTKPQQDDEFNKFRTKPSIN